MDNDSIKQMPMVLITCIIEAKHQKNILRPSRRCSTFATAALGIVAMKNDDSQSYITMKFLFIKCKLR